MSPQDQFESHVHDGLLNVYTYYGSERTKDTKLLAGQDVVLTTYQTLSSEFTKVLLIIDNRQADRHTVDSLFNVVDTLYFGIGTSCRFDQQSLQVLSTGKCSRVFFYPLLRCSDT